MFYLCLMPDLFEDFLDSTGNLVRGLMGVRVLPVGGVYFRRYLPLIKINFLVFVTVL